MWTHAHKVSYEVSLICFASPTSLCRKKQSDTLTENRVNCRYWVIGCYLEVAQVFVSEKSTFLVLPLTYVEIGHFFLNFEFIFTPSFNSEYCSVYVLFVEMDRFNRVLIFSHNKKEGIMFIVVTLFITHRGTPSVEKNLTNLMGTKCKHDISSVTSQVTEECESNHIQTVFEALLCLKNVHSNMGQKFYSTHAPITALVISLNEWIFKLQYILGMFVDSWWCRVKVNQIVTKACIVGPNHAWNRWQEGFNFKAIFFQAD